MSRQQELVEKLSYNNDYSHRNNWYQYFTEIIEGIDKDLNIRSGSRTKRTLSRMLKFRDSRRFRIWIDTYAKALTSTIRTQVRDLIILPVINNIDIHVYNGKAYIKINTGTTSGRRLGELVETRIKPVHSAKKAVKQSKSK